MAGEVESMNLVVTRECNRACSYCFAKRRMVQWQRKEEKEVSNVSVRDVEYFLSFLSASGIQEFRILGGEPSLHPEFVEIVQLGLKRGFEIFVFTNGLWPDSVQRFFDQCQDGRIRFIFNLNEPETETLWENDRQKRSLEIVGGRGSIGFNMYRSNFDLKFVVDIADTFSLKRAVRIGLAQPIVRKQNDYLNSEELRAAGKRLAEQLEMLEEEMLLHRSIAVSRIACSIRTIGGNWLGVLPEDWFRIAVP